MLYDFYLAFNNLWFFLHKKKLLKMILHSKQRSWFHRFSFKENLAYIQTRTNRVSHLIKVHFKVVYSEIRWLQLEKKCMKTIYFWNAFNRMFSLNAIWWRKKKSIFSKVSSFKSNGKRISCQLNSDKFKSSDSHRSRCHKKSISLILYIGSAFNQQNPNLTKIFTSIETHEQSFFFLLSSSLLKLDWVSHQLLRSFYVIRQTYSNGFSCPIAQTCANYFIHGSRPKVHYKCQIVEHKNVSLLYRLLFFFILCKRMSYFLDRNKEFRRITNLFRKIQSVKSTEFKNTQNKYIKHTHKQANTYARNTLTNHAFFVYFIFAIYSLTFIRKLELHIGCFQFFLIFEYWLKIMMLCFKAFPIVKCIQFSN